MLFDAAHTMLTLALLRLHVCTPARRDVHTGGKCVVYRLPDMLLNKHGAPVTSQCCLLLYG